MSFILDPIPGPEPFGAVLYTDGGSRLQEGLAGWGMHGYLYPINELKKVKFTKKKDAPSNLGYVDGRETGYNREYPAGDRIITSLKNKGKLYDHPNPPSAVPVEPTHFIDGYGGRPRQTVNQVELLAMKQAFDFILEHRPTQTTILADSMYVLDGLLRDYPNWEKAGGLLSGGGPVKNWDAWKELYNLFRKVYAEELVIYFAHVSGHSGDPGNDKADYNANKGMILELRESNVDRHCSKVPKEYTVKSKLNCRLMEQRWWYGRCDRKSGDYGFEGKHVYFFGNHGKAETEEDYVGKDTATGKAAILLTSEPEPVLDLLSEKLEKRYYRGISQVTLGYLENILKTERYAAFLEEGEDILYPDPYHPVLVSPDKVPILKVLDPPYHGFYLLGQFESLLRILERYIAGDEGIISTDLTPYVYQTVHEKTKVVYKSTPAIDPPNQTVKFPLRYCVDLKTIETREVKMKMGSDLPTRNTLVAVAGPDTKITGITYRDSSLSFRYMTIVETPEGILLTTSLKSNQIILIGKRA